MRLAVFGSGMPLIAADLAELASCYPGRVVLWEGYEEVLLYLIFASSDAVCIPSRFEPSGLSDLVARLLGAIPIVRRTGGLRKSCEPHGFSFDGGAEELLDTLQTAIQALRTDSAELWAISSRSAQHVISEYS